MSMSLMSLEQFSAELASSSPAPGGGSASALSGAVAASLSSMVANLTVGKKGYEESSEEMIRVAQAADKLRKRLLCLIDIDADSFNDFLAAMKLPKVTDEEKAARSQKIQQALKTSALVPMEIAQISFDIFELAALVLEKGNANAVTDALVSAMLARTAVLGALLNVRINLLSIKDEAFVAVMKAKADVLERSAKEKEAFLLSKATF